MASPLISVIAESLRGSVSLKAYERQQFQAYKYNLCSEASVSSNSHLAWAENFFYLKVELILGGLAIAVTSIAVVLVKLNKFGYDGSSSASTSLSLSLTWVTSITDWVAFTLLCLNLISLAMASTERILEYAYPEPNDVEYPAIKPEDEDLIKKNWP